MSTPKSSKSLVFATNNSHKLREIREIAGLDLSIRSLAEIGCTDDIPEDAPTLEGNALAKARFIHQKYGYDCFADDTGLEVEALNGRPGVKSARYAGDDCIAGNNIRKLLRELAGVENRRARFRTVIALILDGREMLFEGYVNGTILTEVRGGDGFGYDPVFRPDGHKESFAEMPADLKNQISHRGMAMNRLIGYLKQAASPH